MKNDLAAACRFFSAEDASRLAAQAYAAASGHLEPPPGEPWMVDGEPYATAADFADAFNDEMRARLALLALDRLGKFAPPSHLWDPVLLAAHIDPEKMAPIVASLEAESGDDDGDFSDHEMHGLPSSDNPGNNRPAKGPDNAD